MGAKFRPITQADFSGGINAVTSPFLVLPKQVVAARNLILDEHGALSTRDGYSVVSTGTDTSNPIVYRGVLNKTDLSSRPYAWQNNGTLNTLYRTDTSTWTTIGSSRTAYTTPQAVTVVNREIFAMGYEVPWSWDGTIFTNITAAGGQTVPPGAKHVAFHLGSVWLWNTNAATTALDGPSSLRMSDVNNPNSWPNANQTFIAKDDGQVGMGLATYTIVETGISPTSTLIAFKNYSAYQITGVFGVSGQPIIQRIKSDMGCIAPRTIQFVSGFGLIRLTHKGFALYNGVDDRLISEEVRPYIFGRDDITGLNFGTIDRAVAVQTQNPPLYICAAPIGGTALSRIFVYDLIRRAWTICDYSVNLQSLSLFSTPATQPVVHAGRATNGQILALFNGAEDDDGVPIEWSMRTRGYFVGSFMRPAYWRRVIVDMAVRGASPVNVTVTTSLGGHAASPSGTATFTPLSTTDSVYGTATYGYSQYGAGGLTDARASVDILRTAPTCTLTINGTGQVRLRGLEIHTVPKRLTRVAA
jgi:hypothetical protein